MPDSGFCQEKRGKGVEEVEQGGTLTTDRSPKLCRRKGQYSIYRSVCDPIQHTEDEKVGKQRTRLQGCFVLQYFFPTSSSSLRKLIQLRK